MKYVLPFLAVLLLNTSFPFVPNRQAAPRAGKAGLAAKIPVWLKQYKVPAVGVAVIKDGKVEWAEVFGERAPGNKATRDTVFNVASLTKPVFAVMALHLVARGELDLDANLAEYWVDPDIADDARHRKLTPRIILSHQTGFPNWRRNQKLSFAFDPGTKYQYSGEGVEYLKRAIERKMRKPMPELAKSLIFEPAKMTSTSFTWNEKAEGRFAIGYDRSAKPYPIPKRQDPSAADDLLTTIDDYARFAAWVINGAGLPTSLFKQMQSPQVRVEGNFSFGLGWQLLAAGETFLSHGGSDEGVKTEVVLAPASREGVVILTNSDNGDLLTRLIIEEAIEKGRAIQNATALEVWHSLERFSEQELGKLIGRLAESPFIMDKLMQAAEAQFLNQPGLNNNEKREARSVFRLFICAMVMEKVGKGTIDEMTALLFKRKPNGDRQLNQNVSNDELRAFIKLARREAGKTGVAGND